MKTSMKPCAMHVVITFMVNFFTMGYFSHQKKHFQRHIIGLVGFNLSLKGLKSYLFIIILYIEHTIHNHTMTIW